MDALQLRRTMKLCSRLSSSKVLFCLENAILRFKPPLGARGNVRCSSIGSFMIGKRVVRILLVLIELFLLGAIR